MTRPSFGLLLSLALISFTAMIYGALPEAPAPEEILFGEVEQPALFRGPGVFLGPVLMLGLWVVLRLFPRVDPWREPGEEYGSSYWIVGHLVLLVMASFHLLLVGLALGWPVDATHLLVVLPAFFFLAVGSYLPTVPANWILGVRTPWTLRDEGVWRETHKMAGRTFAVGGILLLGAIFLNGPQRIWAVLAGLAIAGGIPAGYSYLVWRRTAT